MARSFGDKPVPLTGVPEGLAAFSVQEVRPDGVVVRTRRGRTKLETVELRAHPHPTVSAALDEREKAFVVGAKRRRWSTVETHYGAVSWNATVRLVLVGAITLRCHVESASRLGGPISWTLTEDWDEERRRRSVMAATDADDWRARSALAAEGVTSVCPELAALLRRPHPNRRTLPIFVYAAEDLAAGVSHAGPRAFSQAHFEHTKARDDVATVLRAAGVPESIVVILGLRRSDRLGVAGPVVARVDGEIVALDLLDGPVLVRADQRGLRLVLSSECPLVLVENLQAAEIVADQIPEVALVYTAGLLGAAALDLVAGLVGDAERVLIAVDADAGGVRIAEQLLRVAPDAIVLDAGEQPHSPREPWAPEGVAVETLERALDGPSRALAAACLRRGYPVEQEAAIVASIAHALS